MLFNQHISFEDDGNTLVVRIPTAEMPRLTSTERMWLVSSSGGKYNCQTIDPQNRQDLFVNCTVYQSFTPEERILVADSNWSGLQQRRPFVAMLPHQQPQSGSDSV